MIGLKQKQNEGRLLSVSESREIIKKFSDYESDFASTIKDKNNRIKYLEDEVNKLYSYQSSSENMSSTKLKILNILKNREEAVEISRIYDDITDEELYVKKNALEELREDGLIEIYDSYNELFTITALGRKELIKHENSFKEYHS